MLLEDVILWRYILQTPARLSRLLILVTVSTPYGYPVTQNCDQGRVKGLASRAAARGANL
jgi:hypothetical protein